MNDERIWDLLARYWAGHLPRSEADELRAWLAERPDNVQVLRGVTRIMNVSRDLRAADQTADALERVQQRIHRNVSAVRPLRLPLFARTIRQRTPASRSRRIITTAVAGMAATVVAVFGVMEYRARAAGADAVAMREYTTRRGERAEFVLPDGSRVTLGPQTTMRVAMEQYSRERTVHLDGVANVDVAHDPSRPFTVMAGGAAARAVGTSFTVRAYSEDSTVKVIVVTGRVLFRHVESAPETGALLAAGEAAEMSAAGVTSIRRDVDVDGELGWVNGRVRYSLATVESVARDLERWYDVSITVDQPALARVRLTMAFDPASPPAETIGRLAELLNAKVEQNGREVRLFRSPPVAAAPARTSVGTHLGEQS